MGRIASSRLPRGVVGAAGIVVGRGMTRNSRLEEVGSLLSTQSIGPGQVLFSIPLHFQVSALDAFRDPEVQQLLEARHVGDFPLDASAYLAAYLALHAKMATTSNP